MMNKAKESKMLPVSFRVDPDELEIFRVYCDQIFTTRSEAFRAIFNNHINTLKQKQNETNDLERI